MQACHLFEIDGGGFRRFHARLVRIDSRHGGAAVFLEVVDVGARKLVGASAFYLTADDKWGRKNNRAADHRVFWVAVDT